MKASGIVIKVFPDDTKGSKHQKFTVKLKNNKTVLVIHNIDIAPKIYGLKVGDRVEFLGQYQWNSQGGMVHWTHHDPHAQHPIGWIKHNGKFYS
ncbi:DUF3465 domain-containing protein [Thalassotalea sp. G2M2-11]|uniref:DUF3465 domain-containing protein n=1 Tax=Thalassotalea sp. G2M2-11 TaxID=2787627 RepID=UPI0019D2221F|nr:DUF3465 domain-containing protein [Thalassotalea sp. G2M2-11]